MNWPELQELLADESAAVEWKQDGDPEKVALTLTAFANDIGGRGGGWVICGVKEEKDETGARRAHPVGLSPNRIKQLRDHIPRLLRTHATPPLIPRIEVISLPEPVAVTLLAFRVDASPHAHSYRCADNNAYHPIRVDDDTRRANGHLEELLRRKRVLPPLLEDSNQDATRDDLDERLVRTYLERLELPQDWRTYLRPDVAIEAGIPALITRSRDGHEVPRNFALLLFGREPRRFFPGAFALLSVYPGDDRAGDRSEASPDITGPVPEMFDKLMGWLQRDLGFEVDKTYSATSGLQNRPRYSKRAVEEAIVNALVHRDYSLPDPVRISVFSDRLEIASPGGLVDGVNPDDVRTGQATATWRNPALASFVFRLGIAQRRGQGIPVILKATRELTGKDPIFKLDARWFTVIIPAVRPRRLAPTATPGLRGGDALLLVAVAAPSIREQVLASLPELGLQGAPIVVDHTTPSYIESGGGDWQEAARQIRDLLRGVVDRPEYHHFHLFYRGPVVLAPLIGALIASVKPLHIYAYEEGRYVHAHTLDKKFLRG